MLTFSCPEGVSLLSSAMTAGVVNELTAVCRLVKVSMKSSTGRTTDVGGQ